MTKDVISLSISVLLLFRHYISQKITFGAPSSGGVLCSACGAFICHSTSLGVSSPQRVKMYFSSISEMEVLRMITCVSLVIFLFADVMLARPTRAETTEVEQFIENCKYYTAYSIVYIQIGWLAL